MLLFAACSKHDPILPGARTNVFDDGSAVTSQNTTIAAGRIQMPAGAMPQPTNGATYAQDADNVVWSVAPDGAKTRIFSGLPTMSRVSGVRNPVTAGGFVYAGLTTGEVVKINPKTRAPVWVADVFKPSAMTGGAPIMDIVAPVYVLGDSVYAGGLGDAFCRINDKTGKTVWCAGIGTGVPFIIAGDVAFVSATDNFLYAIDIKNGAVFWFAAIAAQTAPILTKTDDGIYHVVVGREKFLAATGASETKKK